MARLVAGHTHTQPHGGPHVNRAMVGAQKKYPRAEVPMLCVLHVMFMTRLCLFALIQDPTVTPAGIVRFVTCTLYLIDYSPQCDVSCVNYLNPWETDMQTLDTCVSVIDYN